MNATPESLIKEYADPIEQQEIDKFICSEMSRQIHRYIKGMSGTKQAMLKFEEKLASLSVTEKEKAIAKYIDLNRKALDGLDLKMILVRSVANYCDTFQYMLDFVNDKRKMVFYYHRLKEKYIRYHEVFEENGKFGMKDHQGNVMLRPVYDFLRTCYIYNDDLSIINRTLHQAAKLMNKGMKVENNAIISAIYGNYTLGMIVRAGQANMVAMEMRDSNLPCIVAGDFNDVPYSYVYNTMMGENMVDGFKECGTGFMSTYRGKKPVRIDYIMHDKSMSGSSYYTKDLTYSDHIPVFMSIGL